MDLDLLLKPLPSRPDPNLIVGFDTSDDAGIYRLRQELALVQTVDIITPVCDDPYLFGQVAAANSLSDVYAMGGRPLTALNVCCFPSRGVPPEVLGRILEGGAAKAEEAGAALVGGHTVKDEELKYGLSVTGTVHPDRILRNSGARPGDLLVLTKPLGTGVMINGFRRDSVSQEAFEPVLRDMVLLNSEPGRLALELGASACTDVTGFGAVGHGLEMARAGGVGIRFHLSRVPVYEEGLPLFEKGIGVGATRSIRALAGEAFRAAGQQDEIRPLFLLDPQTSGGLLIAIPAPRAEDLVLEIRKAGHLRASVVGEVISSEYPIIELPPS